VIRLDRDNMGALYVRGVLVAHLDDDQADLVEAVLASPALSLTQEQAEALAVGVKAARIEASAKAFPVGSRVRHRTVDSLGVGTVKARECDDDECRHREGIGDAEPDCDIGACPGYVLISWRALCAFKRTRAPAICRGPVVSGFSSRRAASSA